MQNEEHGYTLIEVLVAMGVFAIAYGAVAGMLINAIQSTTRGKVLTEAMEIAASYGESLHALPFYPYFEKDGAEPDKRFAHPERLAEGKSEIEAGRFRVSIVIDDDKPLAAVPNIYTEDGEPGIVTVSKTITIAVYESRKPGTILAEIESAKFWEQDL